MSIDSPNAQFQTSSGSNADFNYIDTYVEFIVEVVLKFDNAIPESNDRQQKELQQHKQFEVMFQKIVPVKLSNFSELNVISFLNSPDNYEFQFIKEINPPPPGC